MGRHRLGVVLIVPEPWAAEVDGLRRALGDEALDRVAPHITLVRPVNVLEEDLPAALDGVHAAAAACPPLLLTLGRVRTFAPVNPVAYLEVTGAPEAMGSLVALRDAVHTGPFDRSEDWPFVPHVTVCNDLPGHRLAASTEALSEYRADVRFERVQVLAEQPERIWEPVADAALSRS
jgi:2'-5' RNA ligase